MFTFLTRILEEVKRMTTGINIVTHGDSQSPIIILNRCFSYINQMLNIYICTFSYEVCISMSEQ